MKTKYYGDDTELDREVQQMVDREVLCCDSALVAACFESDYIENVYYTKDEDDDDYDEEQAGECKDILEWWRVTKWACDKLRQQGEPVIDHDYGCWWGRTCSGQAIVLDSTWYDIKHRMESDLAEMLSKK